MSLQMPPFGLGMWKSAPGEVKAAIKSAVDAGYRLFDGAAAYGNEKEVAQNSLALVRARDWDS